MISSKISRRAWLVSGCAALFSAPFLQAAEARTFRRIPYQYIAVLAPEQASSGSGAEAWGFWREDPGPIGVFLKYYNKLRKAGGFGPTGWQFDINDWWLDENGLLMKAPVFPMPAGEYYVTNGEEHISLLTVDKPDSEGKQSWTLSDGKTIANVTHGPCRSARYTPRDAANQCSPENAPQSVFPLAPGERPPSVNHCDKKEYAVLIVFAVPAQS